MSSSPPSSSSSSSSLTGSIIGCKVGSMLVMILVGIIGALIPLFLRRFKMHTAMSLSNAFAGGAFLALGLFHILPDAVDELEKAGVFIHVGAAQYNIAYLLVFVGYVIILFCESVLFDPGSKEVMSQDHGSHAHHHSPCALVVISPKCKTDLANGTERRKGNLSGEIIYEEEENNMNTDTVEINTSSINNESIPTDAHSDDNGKLFHRDGVLTEATGGLKHRSDAPFNFGVDNDVSIKILHENNNNSNSNNNNNNNSNNNNNNNNNNEYNGTVEILNSKGKTRKEEGITKHMCKKSTFEGSNGDQFDTQHYLRCCTDVTRAEVDAATLRSTSSTSSDKLILRVAKEIEKKKETGMCHEKEERPVSMFSSGAFFLMLALAIHGFFEGVIVGTCTTITGVWMTSLVILGHKWAESFALMSQFITQKLGLRLRLILISIFVVSSPIGIAAGMGLADVDVSAGVCNALGTGTVLFVASEITSEVFAEGGRIRLVKFVVYILGSALVFGLTMLEQSVESNL